ncbi:hypothetical protein [Paenibacillus caui]|uniref:hypothetical protein n=1 Tax=Paenibacillus caui TaxID=2873927 RepID=UPI001CA80603|nr:hypothetical protein [Paenibacillus caui]
MKVLSRLLSGMMLCSAFLLSAACDSENAAVQPDSVAHRQNDGIELWIDGGNLMPDVRRALHVDFSSDLNVRKVLENSGIVALSEDEDGIKSVGNISLDNELYWGVKVNGMDSDASAWDKVLKRGDEILVCLKKDSDETDALSGQIVLKMSGGTSNPSLKHYFVNLYHDNLTVRDLLLNSGMIRMNNHYQLVTAVNGYMARVNEKWIVKLNNKKLLESGLDRKLQPSDTVEVILSQI